MHALSESQYFHSFMAMAIVLNTVSLALDKYPIDLI
jgi:hypothetical protein